MLFCGKMMFELVRGDPSALEGKVLLYSELNANLNDFKKDPLLGQFDSKFLANSNSAIIGYFASLDYDEVAARVGNNKEITPKIFHDVSKFPIHEKGLEGDVDFSVIQLGFYTENEARKEQADIICSGSYAYPSLCRQSMSVALKIYGLKLTEQFYQRNGKMIGSKKIQSGVKINHNIPDENIGLFIENNYLRYMLDARNRGDEHALVLLRRELLHKSQKTVFESEVSKLCHHINVHETPNPELLSAYVKIVKAIEEEDFESAADLKRQVNAIENKR